MIAPTVNGPKVKVLVWPSAVKSNVTLNCEPGVAPASTAISISVALSEGYIIITVLLGMYVNKEFLGKHQKIGLFLAVVSAIALAYFTI